MIRPYPTREAEEAADLAHLEAFRAARPDWDVVHGAVGDSTAEPWLDPLPASHPYAEARAWLRTCPIAGRVLDIGSPNAVLTDLAERSTVTDVVAFDLRVRDLTGVPLRVWPIMGAATELPVPSASFDAVTSVCVLCHVGTGRYNDPLEVDADYQMLREVCRVLRPGGRLAMMVGPISHEACRYEYNAQRVYTWAWLDAALLEAGFNVRELWTMPSGYGCVLARSKGPRGA